MNTAAACPLPIIVSVQRKFNNKILPAFKYTWILSYFNFCSKAAELTTHRMESGNHCLRMSVILVWCY